MAAFLLLSVMNEDQVFNKTKMMNKLIKLDFAWSAI